MKVSFGIFLVGIILTVVLVMIILADLGNSDHLMYGLVSEDIFDKIITLYFFIIIMKFFFGGIVYYFESGMKTAEKIPLSEAEFDLEANDLNEEYLEYVKTRSTEKTH